MHRGTIGSFGTHDGESGGGDNDDDDDDDDGGDERPLSDPFLIRTSGIPQPSRLGYVVTILLLLMMIMVATMAMVTKIMISLNNH